jgi:hypothetical protein
MPCHSKRSVHQKIENCSNSKAPLCSELATIASLHNCPTLFFASVTELTFNTIKISAMVSYPSQLPLVHQRDTLIHPWSVVWLAVKRFGVAVVGNCGRGGSKQSAFRSITVSSMGVQRAWAVGGVSHGRILRESFEIQL